MINCFIFSLKKRIQQIKKLWKYFFRPRFLLTFHNHYHLYPNESIWLFALYRKSAPHCRNYRNITMYYCHRCIEFAQTSLMYLSQNITPFYIKHIPTQDYDSFEDTLINKNPVIMNRTSQTDQELANIMGKYRDLLKIQAVTMNEPALQKIKELIPLIKKECNVR